jgi:MFS family permease
MDQTTPREQTLAKPLKPAQMALAVLALCFVLSMIGRGLGETFTVFLKPISANFGWDRAQVVSVYSLTWLVSGLTAPLVGRLLDRSGPRLVYSLGVFLLGAAFTIAPTRNRCGSSSSPSGFASALVLP